MRNRKGYTRVDEGTIRSDTYPHLGIQVAEWNGTGWYQIKHFPTNSWVALVEGQDEAMALLEVIGQCPGLETAKLTQENVWYLQQVVAGWTNRPVRPRPMKEGTYPRLDPIYRPGVTPSPAVRASDRALASVVGRAMAGDRTVTLDVLVEATEEACTRAWREEIMARVPGLKQREVPDRVPRLLDGTVSGWEGFTTSFATLVHLGDRLQQGAIRILAMADTFDQTGEVDRGKWDRLGEKFSDLIREGWMEWTACAAHYINSPEVRQAQVVKRVGFVGSPERGYHELGLKTFLRHPEVHEAIKRRRVVDMWLREQEV